MLACFRLTKGLGMSIHTENFLRFIRDSHIYEVGYLDKRNRFVTKGPETWVKFYFQSKTGRFILDVSALALCSHLYEANPNAGPDTSMYVLSPAGRARLAELERAHG